MLNHEEMFTKVQAVVVAQLGVDASEVTEKASIINDLGADSLDSVELIMALEDVGGEIPDSDAEDLKTVGQVVEYLLAHQKTV